VRSLPIRQELIQRLSAARPFSIHLLVQQVLDLVIYAGAKLRLNAVRNNGTRNESAGLPLRSQAFQFRERLFMFELIARVTDSHARDGDGRF
jgi:hypothetical protein